MAEITSIDEYRRRWGRPARQPAGSPQTPRARSAGDATFEVDDVLKRLEAIRGELTHYLIDLLEDGAVDRLDQIRRYGLGLSRTVSIAVARKVEHEGLRDLVRVKMQLPRLELRRGLHLRLLEVPVTCSGRTEPDASAHIVLIREDKVLAIVAAAVKRDGVLAQTTLFFQRPCEIIYWSRDVVDQLLRRFLRELFEELEAGEDASASS